jgi:hypothetical protein
LRADRPGARVPHLVAIVFGGQERRIAGQGHFKIADRLVMQPELRGDHADEVEGNRVTRRHRENVTTDEVRRSEVATGDMGRGQSDCVLDTHCVDIGHSAICAGLRAGGPIARLPISNMM